MNSIKENKFGSIGAKEAREFTISSDSVSASFTDFGATLTKLIIPDREGRPRDVVLGYDDVTGYYEGNISAGATVGRYAGRIGGSRFTLGGKEYRLVPNDGANHLHGPYAKRFFEAETIDDRLRFTLLSPDGDEGYPGGLNLSLTVSVSGGRLALQYEATTESETVLNITNHSYFNLNGTGDALGHELKLFSDAYAETDPGLIPTGRILPVYGTEYDFTSPKSISSILCKLPDGLDTSFILPEGSALKKAAELYSEESGIRLTVSTTQSTVHVYTGAFVDRDSGPLFKNGQKQMRFGGIALETQHLPDSPNKRNFPSTVLKRGEVFRQTTELEFTVK